MRVQYRLLAIIILLGLTMMAGLFILQQNQREQMSAVMVARQVELDALFKRIIEQESKSIETLAFDYTYWDEMVSFIQTKDPEWASNLLDPALESYDINAIWIYDPEMVLVYQTTNLSGGIAPPIPLSDKELRDLFLTHPLTEFSFRAPDNTIIEVRGATIHPTADVAHATLPRGYFFVGRAWLPERLDALGNLTMAQVRLAVSAQEAQPSSDARNFTVYFPLNDAQGYPLAYISGTYDSRYTQGFIEIQQNYMQFFSMFAVLLLLILAGIFILWVFIPLQRISSSLKEGTTQKIQPLLKDKGEFGRIARLIGDFFQQKTAMAAQIHQQEQTASALRLSEQRYRVISQLSSDSSFVLLLDPAGLIQVEWGLETINQKAGLNLTNPLDIEIVSSIFHPEDREKIKHWQSQLAKSQTVEEDVRILNQQNSVHWIHLKMSPLSANDGNLAVRIYGVARDITGQKVSEEAYHSLVDQSAFGLCLIQGYRIVFANPSFCQMVGNTREELKGLDPNEILIRIYPDDLESGSSVLKSLFSQEIPFATQAVRIKHHNGSWRWMELTGSLVDYRGKPTLQISCNDVSDRIANASALAEQREYSSILFNTVSSWILITDPQGRITAVNPTAQPYFDNASRIKSDPYLWDVFDIPEQSPLSAQNFVSTSARGEPIDGIRLPINSNGKQQWLNWSHRYQYDANGKLTSVIGTATDITETHLRELQQEAVARIASTLRGNTSRKETLQAILETIQEYLGAHTVSVVVPIPETGEMVIEASLGAFSTALTNTRFSENASIAGTVMRSGKPYFSNDPGREDQFALKNLANQIGPTAWAPLISEGRPIGTLIFSRSTPITTDDIDLFQPVADMAAGAIDRTTRSEQAQKRIQQLSALQSINLAIGVSLDLHMTLNILAAQMTTQLGIDAVAVFLLNPAEKILHCTAQSGFRSAPMANLRLWEGEGQAGRVVMERRSRHLHNPDGISNQFFPPDLIVGEDFIAYDAVPLIVKGEIKGVIEAYHRAPYAAAREWPQLLEALATETAIAIDNAELLAKLQRSNQDLKIAYDSTIEGWARSLEQFGIEWGKHSRRVVDLTVKLAQWMGVSGDQLTNIRYGALLHDIGKIGVPLTILDKPGKLTPEEWTVVKRHPNHAYAILHDIPFLVPALDIPYYHHERWDGSGYPDGLKGEEIPLAARIFAVVDIFDALTNTRPYREAWSEEKALAYLSDTAGREIDPAIAKAFLEMYSLLGRAREN